MVNKARKKRVNIKTGLKNPMINKVSRISPLLLICTLGIIIYSNSFDCSFQFDDAFNITGNQAIRDIGDLKAIWDFYYIKTRFVGIFSFALNYHFHQLDVFGYHFVNLLVHIGASFFVWWLTILILSTPIMQNEEISKHKRLIATGCSLIFMSHPLQTQAVTYIVQRLASLAALFYLASLCFYIKARLTKKNYVSVLCFVSSALSALLGMFTKEIVFTLPFAMILFELSFFNKGKLKEIIKNKRILTYTVLPLLFALIIPAMLSFNFKFVFGSVTSNRYLDPPITSAIYLMTQFRVIVTYIKLLFLPINQNLDYDFPVSRSFFDLSTLLSFLFLVSIIFVAVRIFPRRRLAAVGILWFFLTLSVESSIKPIGNVIFEHRLYLPMFGFSLFFVSTLYQILWEKHSETVIIILMSVICCYSFLTYERNKVWRNDFTLWNDVVKKSPNKSRPHNYFGIALSSRGRFDEAIQEFRSALRINPDYTNAHNNLGVTLSSQGKFKEAVQEFKEALRINPGYADIYVNLGNIFFKEGNLEEAKNQFNKSLQINPENAYAHHNLGTVFNNQGKVEEAIQEFKEALRINPGYTEAYNNLGNIYFKEGNFEEAKDQFSRALRINPQYAEVYVNLGNIYFKEGNLEEAKNQFNKALRINPNYADAYNNLGNILYYQGEIEGAIREFQNVLRINPQYAEVYYNLGNIYFRKGELNEAVKYFKNALTINGNDYETHYFLGVVFDKKGITDEAIEHFLEALRIKPDYINAHLKLAGLYKSQGKLTKSQVHLDEANRLEREFSQKKEISYE